MFPCRLKVISTYMIDILFWIFFDNLLWNLLITKQAPEAPTTVLLQYTFSVTVLKIDESPTEALEFVQTLGIIVLKVSVFINLYR